MECKADRKTSQYHDNCSQSRDTGGCMGCITTRNTSTASRNRTKHWVMLFTVILFVQFAAASAFSCSTVCDRSKCKPPGNCPFGQTTDECDCCVKCAKGENETCGGVFGSAGKCASGLECRIKASTGLQLAGGEEGLCKASLSSSTTLDCSVAQCQVVFVPDCPSDSYAMKGEVLPGKCCPERPSCLCLPCVVFDPVCPMGHIKVLVKTGLGVAGNCCDEYECRSREEVCRSVECDDDPLSNITCPDDSYQPPPEIYNHGCCIRHRQCECKAPFNCPPLECPTGTHARLVRLAQVPEPGSCCDVYTCDNDTCIHGEVERQNGEVWENDHCNYTCRSGVIQEMQTCPENLNCGFMTKPPGECCHVCAGNKKCLAYIQELTKSCLCR